MEKIIGREIEIKMIFLRDKISGVIFNESMPMVPINTHKNLEV